MIISDSFSRKIIYDKFDYISPIIQFEKDFSPEELQEILEELELKAKIYRLFYLVVQEYKLTECKTNSIELFENLKIFFDVEKFEKIEDIDKIYKPLSFDSDKYISISDDANIEYLSSRLIEEIQEETARQDERDEYQSYLRLKAKFEPNT